MNCMNCGAPIQAGSDRCRKCGSAVESARQPMVQSGEVTGQQAPVNVVVQLGPAVGMPPAQPVAGAPKSKIVAGILGILLGFLGVHRFYLGYTGIGVVQLLLTVLTCGYGALITGPWGLIEGILILVGTMNRDGWGRPLED